MPDSEKANSNKPVDAHLNGDSVSASGELPSEPVLRRVLCWLTAGMVVAVLASTLLALLPARVRLLGLFAVIEGSLVGLVLGRAAQSLKMHYRRTALVGGGIAGALSVMVTSVLWWQNWSAVKEEVKPKPEAAIAAQMLEQLPEPDDSDPEAVRSYEQSRAHLEAFLQSESDPGSRHFGDWLVHRATPLSTNRIAAIGLWGLELMLAGVATGWLVKRQASRPFCAVCQSWRQVVRVQEFADPVPDRLRWIVPELITESTSAVTVGLSGCGCRRRRPDVSFDVEGVGNQQEKRLRGVELSDHQFGELKALLDEAQGMK